MTEIDTDAVRENLAADYPIVGALCGALDECRTSEALGWSEAHHRGAALAAAEGERDALRAALERNSEALAWALAVLREADDPDVALPENMRRANEAWSMGRAALAFSPSMEQPERIQVGWRNSENGNHVGLVSSIKPDVMRQAGWEPVYVKREPAPQAEPDRSEWAVANLTIPKDAEPDRCPTCRSTDKEKYGQRPEPSMVPTFCGDRWHTEGADR